MPTRAARAEKPRRAAGTRHRTARPATPARKLATCQLVSAQALMAAPAVENRAAPATSSRRLRSDAVNPPLLAGGGRGFRHQRHLRVAAGREVAAEGGLQPLGRDGVDLLAAPAQQDGVAAEDVHAPQRGQPVAVLALRHLELAPLDLLFLAEVLRSEARRLQAVDLVELGRGQLGRVAGGGAARER